MCLALNMAKMAKGGFSRATVEETQQLKKPRDNVREEKKWGVKIHGHNNLKAAIERHPAMVRENQMDGILPCQNGTAKHPETCWRRKGNGATPPTRATPPPKSPPVPFDDHECSETDGMPPTYVYVHLLLPNASFLQRIGCAIKISFQIC
jgi:hypothetical protein